MKKYLVNWHLNLLVLTASVLSLILIQNYVSAAWQAPAADPGDNTGVNTPLVSNDSGQVDLANNDIINVGNLEVDTLTATTSVTVLGSFNANALETDDLVVPHTVGGSGAIDLSAINSEVDVSATAPAAGQSSQALKATAGLTAASNAYAYGLYASTVAGSGVNPSYAVAGVSNNAGGVAVYGLGSSGWAGYFSGPVGIAGAVSMGNNTTASGAYAVSMGNSTTASGDYSLAAGDSSQATASESTAFGFASEANAGATFAAGSEAIASGFAAVALGMNPIASGVQSIALGYYAQASAENAMALGTITVSGLNSLGINLNYGSPQTLAQDNAMAIMGGNVGINTVTPSYQLHLIGSYYQDGMMQVRPTTVLGASENIIYANLPSGSSSSANVILLQNNGSNRFKVTAGGVGTFASGVVATYANFSGALTVTGLSTLNGGATVAGNLTMKTGGYMSFNNSSGSYFDFSDDSGAAPPTCSSGYDGRVYNFAVNQVLCYCDGSSWISMVNGKADSLCATK